MGFGYTWHIKGKLRHATQTCTSRTSRQGCISIQQTHTTCQRLQRAQCSSPSGNLLLQVGAATLTTRKPEEPQNHTECSIPSENPNDLLRVSLLINTKMPSALAFRVLVALADSHMHPATIQLSLDFLTSHLYRRQKSEGAIDEIQVVIDGLGDARHGDVETLSPIPSSHEGNSAAVEVAHSKISRNEHMNRIVVTTYLRTREMANMRGQGGDGAISTSNSAHVASTSQNPSGSTEPHSVHPTVHPLQILAAECACIPPFHSSTCRISMPWYP